MSKKYSDNFDFDNINEVTHLFALGLIEQVIENIEKAGKHDLISFIEVNVYQRLINEAILKLNMVFEYKINNTILGSFNPEIIDDYINDVKILVDDAWDFYIDKTNNHMRIDDEFVDLSNSKEK